MGKEVRVKDVAYHAGVSTATVSRVINGDPKVKKSTASKVQVSIEALGYKMNQVARSLKTNKTFTIGIVAPEFKNDFFMNIVTGIESRLRRSGYTVLLCSSSETLIGEIEQLRLLGEKNVDGIILIPVTGKGEHLTLLDGKPVVLVDRIVEGFACDAILSDNVCASYEAVSYAINEGARRIGFLGGDRSLTSAEERYQGYLKALKDNGITEDPSIVLFGDYHEESGYGLMKKLTESKNPPHYIFISNYFMHLGAAKCLLEGKTGEKDLHILSFDDLPLAAFFPYSSLIVAQPMEQIGIGAAELLMKRIDGNKEPPRIERLTTSMRTLN